MPLDLYICQLKITTIAIGCLKQFSLFYISGQKEAMQIQIQNLESKVQLLMRSNQVMEGEMSTLKVQIESRENTLKDTESELQLANSKLELSKSDDRKQQKIDKLNLQVDTYRKHDSEISNRMTIRRNPNRNNKSSTSFERHQYYIQ